MPTVQSIRIAFLLSGLFIASVVLAQQPPGSFQTPSTGPARVDTAALADPSREYVPGELLVKFRSLPSAAPLAAVGAERLQRFARSGVEHWRLGRGVDVEQALRVLRGPSFTGVIEYAEPNYIVHADDFPNDPLRGELWGMHNIAQSGGSQDADIDALEAWKWQASTNLQTIVVGVIDTGIDYNHPDLAANIWTNPGEIPGDGIDNDNNGFVDDVRGWNFYNNDNDPMDDNGHGTHTAGTIGAVIDNGIGVAGVASNVKLVPLKFLGAGGSGATSAAIAAIEYAASFNVPITNNSWGGGQKSRALEDAIKASNSLFVAAAGNSGSSRVQYPAGYSANNIISVAATDNQDRRAGFSNYGSSWVDLGAPGVDTLSTTPFGTYSLMSGTSMAAPHVAGAAALVLGQSPTMTPTGIKTQLMNTVDPIPALAGITASGGRLNVARAVGAAGLPSDSSPPAAIGDLAADANLTTANSSTLVWTASGDDASTGTAYVYDMRYATSPITEQNWESATRASGEPLPAPAGFVETFAIEGLQANTTYHIALKVLDEAGNVSVISNIATATTAPPPPDAWVVQMIEGDIDWASDPKLAYDPADGAPSVAYPDSNNDRVKFAKWNGSSWDTENAGISATGISLAYDAFGNPTISHGWGKLYFTSKSGASWSSEVLEKRRANNDSTSLAYCNGAAAISYRLGGLKVARRQGSAWTTEDVDPGAGARWLALAFDSSCNPAVAYSDDIDADGWLDTLKFARWDGTSWQIQIVDSGPVGYGVSPVLAFDAGNNRWLTGHRGTGQLRFFVGDGSGWGTVESIDNATQYVDGASIALSPSGIPYLAYGAYYGQGSSVIVARRDSPGVWQRETVEFVGDSPSVSLKFAPDGQPSVSYGVARAVWYAKKGTP